MEADLLRNYTNRKDGFGIPIVSLGPEWDHSANDTDDNGEIWVPPKGRGFLIDPDIQALNGLIWQVDETRSIFGMELAFERCLSRVGNLGEKSLPPRSNANIHRTLTENIKILKNEAKKSALRVIDSAHAARSLLGLHLKSFPELVLRPGVTSIWQEPQLLLRAYRKESHTLFHPQMGFLCTALADPGCQPFKDVGERGKPKHVSEQSLRQHCEESEEPSEWISLHKDIAWIWHRIRSHALKQKNSACSDWFVAVVSTEMMDRLDVFWDRSDTMVKRYARGKTYTMKEDGVKYTSPDHYLVHGWIPAQCICHVYDFEHFDSRCRELGIPEDKDRLMPAYPAEMLIRQADTKPNTTVSRVNVEMGTLQL
ncbi:hypothetical protein BDZ85DRAFT_315158 [Elsinoe ampelina]|uniref:DUF7587 domain-containing protein n=1 Tax=Elsinoe ampelina TaxID=302913 RepID=A0A6A6GPH9_9PEZI|nr:hypothetical protein BDZ85DRAFT_315158 [Elsinoe ampelina]